MNQRYTAFLARLLLYAAGLTIVWLWLRSSMPPKFYYEHTWVLVVFFFATTAVFHYGLLSAAEKTNRNVVTYYMLSTSVKLVLYFLVLVGYAMARPGEAVPFVSNFFMLYVFFTVFEVSAAYKHFKSKSF